MRQSVTKIVTVMAYKSLNGKELAAAIGVAPPTLSEAARDDYKLRGRFRPAEWAQYSDTGRIVAYKVPTDALQTMRNAPNTAKIVNKGAKTRENAGASKKQQAGDAAGAQEPPLWVRAVELGMGLAALALIKAAQDGELRAIFGASGNAQTDMQADGGEASGDQIRSDLRSLAAPLLDSTADR
jgi:hypothetical protein